MKLATLQGPTPDGNLMVVSADLTLCAPAAPVAGTMQAALDQWTTIEPQLRQISVALNNGSCAEARPFDIETAVAPLPRSYMMFDAGNYIRHFELMARLFPRPVVGTTFTEPTGYQSGRGRILGARESIEMPSRAEILGIDFEAELAVITDRVPIGATPAEASRHIRLIVLMNDISLRNLGLRELEKGFGLFQSKPICALAPIAVTPDELGSAWDGEKVHLALKSELNGRHFGHPNAGEGMLFGFPDLVAYCAQTREVTAGTIVGGGTVSNIAEDAGSGCIAERRAIETASHGEPRTPFMRFGDTIRIEVQDESGSTVFGAIDQAVVRCLTAKVTTS